MGFCNHNIPLRHVSDVLHGFLFVLFWWALPFYGVPVPLSLHLGLVPSHVYGYLAPSFAICLFFSGLPASSPYLLFSIAMCLSVVYPFI